jgi:serine/threonine protein kinase
MEYRKQIISSYKDFETVIINESKNNNLPFLPEIKPELLSDSICALEKEYFEIILVGERGNGKSTIGSAIIGTPELFPSSVLPGQTVMTVLLRSEIPMVSIVRTGRPPEPIASEEVVRCAWEALVQGKTDQWIDLTYEQVIRRDDKNIAQQDDVEEVIFELPVNLPYGVAIIDTPGLNEVPHLSRKVFERTRKAGAIIIVTGSKGVNISESEERLLKSLNDFEHQCFIVVQNIDSNWQQRNIAMTKKNMLVRLRELGFDPEKILYSFCAASCFANDESQDRIIFNELTAFLMNKLSVEGPIRLQRRFSNIIEPIFDEIYKNCMQLLLSDSSFMNYKLSAENLENAIIEMQENENLARVAAVLQEISKILKGMKIGVTEIKNELGNNNSAIVRSISTKISQSFSGIFSAIIGVQGEIPEREIKRKFEHFLQAIEGKFLLEHNLTTTSRLGKKKRAAYDAYCTARFQEEIKYHVQSLLDSDHWKNQLSSLYFSLFKTLEVDKVRIEKAYANFQFLSLLNNPTFNLQNQSHWSLVQNLFERKSLLQGSVDFLLELKEEGALFAIIGIPFILIAAILSIVIIPLGAIVYAIIGIVALFQENPRLCEYRRKVTKNFVNNLKGYEEELLKQLNSNVKQQLLVCCTAFTKWIENQEVQIVKVLRGDISNNLKSQVDSMLSHYNNWSSKHYPLVVDYAASLNGLIPLNTPLSRKSMIKSTIISLKMEFDIDMDEDVLISTLISKLFSDFKMETEIAALEKFSILFQDEQANNNNESEKLLSLCNEYFKTKIRDGTIQVETEIVVRALATTINKPIRVIKSRWELFYPANGAKPRLLVYESVPEDQINGIGITLLQTQGFCDAAVRLSAKQAYQLKVVNSINAIRDMQIGFDNQNNEEIKRKIENAKTLLSCFCIDPNVLFLSDNVNERLGAFGIHSNVQTKWGPARVKVISNEPEDGELWFVPKLRFIVEAAISCLIVHPRVIRSYGIYFDEKNSYVVMESGVNSLDKYGEALSNLQWTELVEIFISIAESLSFLHSSGVMHADLKLANILNFSRTSFNLKLIDFGISRMYTKPLDISDVRSKAVGTVLYLPPEIFLENAPPLCVAQDIFSFGCVMAACLIGEMNLFLARSLDMENGIKNLMNDVLTTHHVPLSLRNIINSCLDPDPRQRPTAEKALAHLKYVQKIYKFAASPSSKCIICSNSSAALISFIPCNDCCSCCQDCCSLLEFCPICRKKSICETTL